MHFISTRQADFVHRFVDTLPKLLSGIFEIKSDVARDGSPLTLLSKLLERMLHLCAPYGHLTLISLFQDADNLHQHGTSGDIRLTLELEAKRILTKAPMLSTLDRLLLEICDTTRVDGPNRMLNRLPNKSDFRTTWLDEERVLDINLTLGVSFALSKRHDFYAATKGLEYCKACLQSYGKLATPPAVITTTELIKCYNALGQESRAQETALSVLEALTRARYRDSRHDILCFRIAVADTYIGQANYKRAQEELEDLLHDISGTTQNSLYCVAALRLNKVLRRQNKLTSQSLKADSPLGLVVANMKSVSVETQVQCIEEFSSTVVQLPRSALYAETETIEHLATEVQSHVSRLPQMGFVHQRLDEFVLVIESYVQGEDTASLSESSIANSNVPHAPPNSRVNGESMTGQPSPGKITANSSFRDDLKCEPVAKPKSGIDEVSACQHALFLTDPHVDRENLISTKGKRVAGTCEWIRDDDIYQSWLHSGPQLLWISGDPGKGKTMLSIFLTEELERISQETKNAELLFYFCSYQDEKRNTAIAVLRGLVYQIIAKRPNLTKHVLSYFETPEVVQLTLHSLGALWSIFRKLLQDPDLGATFCVLDGLDECDEDSLRLLVAQLVDFFSSQNSQPTDRAFKLVITSREISGLRGVTQIKLDSDYDERVKSDIERVVSVKVEELSRIEGSNEEFRITIQNILLERAEGTFLWVGFVINELSQKTTCTEVLETLRALPRGLHAIYSGMLLRIESSRRHTSSLILRWVTMAIRPLTLQELAAAISIPSAFITADQAVRDLVTFYEPFLKVHEHEVALVHQSARDYLLREEPDGSPVLEAFRIKPEEAHLELARTCFDCIEYSALQYAPQDLNDASCLLESPLLLYAALYWPEHARYCSTYAKELLDLSRPFFQKDSGLRRNWWETCRKIEPWPKAPPLPLLHMASHFGIIPWVRMFLTKKSWKFRFRKLADKKDILGRTPLRYAAWSGHEAVVRLLFDHGAEVDAQDEDETTALMAAADSGHEAVVRLLLDRGADVDAQDKNGRTALMWAANSGHEAVVRLLLDRGVDVDAQDKNGRTALMWAADSGHEAVVRLLLDRGAEVDAQDQGGITALMGAAWLGHVAVVRLLLNRGAEVDAQDQEGVTALMGAARSGYEAVMRLLLDRGANVDVQRKDGGTALMAAASLGHEVAAWSGHEAVVRLLLDRGAEVDVQDQEGGTALMAAAWSGHVAMVRLLLNRGAEVDAQDQEGVTALMGAAGSGHEAAVRLLLDRGADVDAQDKGGGTALMAAAGSGHEAVVVLLLDRGAVLRDTSRDTAQTPRGNLGVGKELRVLRNQAL